MQLTTWVVRWEGRECRTSARQFQSYVRSESREVRQSLAALIALIEMGAIAASTYLCFLRAFAGKRKLSGSDAGRIANAPPDGIRRSGSG